MRSLHVLLLFVDPCAMWEAVLYPVLYLNTMISFAACCNIAELFGGRDWTHNYWAGTVVMATFYLKPKEWTSLGLWATENLKFEPELTWWIVQYFCDLETYYGKFPVFQCLIRGWSIVNMLFHKNLRHNFSFQILCLLDLRTKIFCCNYNCSFIRCYMSYNQWKVGTSKN